MSSIIGQNLKISLFGESHGNAIGVVIDGLNSGIRIDFEMIKEELNKRRSLDNISTSRNELDELNILSGYFNDHTTGTPLCVTIENLDIKSKDYEGNLIRPSHADYAAQLKYHGFQDYRGGGHFSGRITAALVVAGSICKQILKNKNINIVSHIKSIKNIEDDDFVILNDEVVSRLNKNYFPVNNSEVKEKMIALITKAKAEGDSVGGVVETFVLGVEGGIGEPFFDSIEAVLSKLIFSIPGVKGLEFGKGFEITKFLGSEANDQFYYEKEIKTKTNNNGGVNGGITNGMPITLRVAVKPTPSISKTQKTINLNTMKEEDLNIRGRHDPCIVHRALVVIESMIAIGLVDLHFSRYGYQWG